MISFINVCACACACAGSRVRFRTPLLLLFHAISPPYSIAKPNYRRARAVVTPCRLNRTVRLKQRHRCSRVYFEFCCELRDGDIAWTSKSREVGYHTPLRVDISAWRNKFEVASVCKVWLSLGRRGRQNSKYDAGTVTISGKFQVRNRTPLYESDECLLLANLAFYAKMYEGETAFFWESSKVRNRTWLHC